MRKKDLKLHCSSGQRISSVSLDGIKRVSVTVSQRYMPGVVFSAVEYLRSGHMQNLSMYEDEMLTECYC